MNLFPRTLSLAGKIAPYHEELNFINDFLAENKLALNVINVVGRQTTYFLQNVALVLNVARWILLLKSMGHSEIGEVVSNKNVIMGIIGISLLLGAAAVSLITLSLTGTNIHYYFYGFQGFIAGPALIAAYSTVYWRLNLYHRNLILKYQSIFSKKERNEIVRANLRVRTFFIHIC